MKKLTYLTLFFGALTGSFSSPLTAWDDCCDPQSSFSCDWTPCDGKFTIGADWLYWKLDVDNEKFATKTTAIFPVIAAINVPRAIAQPTTSYNKTIDPSFNWDNGVRAYLSYELPGNQWEVGAIFTLINSTANTKLVTAALATPPVTEFTPTEFITTIFPTTSTTGQASSYEATNHYKFAFFDLDLARTICCGNSFRLRPHIGFRAAWFEQHYKSTFVLDTSTALTTNVGFGRLPVKFRGYGLEGGLGAEWLLGCNISLIGQFGGSLLYSKFEAHKTSYEIDTPTGGSPTTVYTQTDHHHYNTGIPSFDYFVGLQYAYDMCDWTIRTQIGWEQHVFFNLKNQDALIMGNLAAQGLTLGLDIGF